ncbi:hypothetical protein HGM15179_014110 [Zosterops borbonicus]|uniref:Uncharacterized protein n=1 Tax=Zosterops borbonicus TaxID=364589 RepID=A0A8K1LGD2_9PASS|nr:hypothetical protein HGM15179_014110 [Zosterops borbonicus]
MKTCFRVSDSPSEDIRGLKASLSEEKCKPPPACLLHGKVEAKEPVGQDYPAQQGAEESLGFRPFVRNISCIFCLWELQSKQKANFGTDVICPLKSKIVTAEQKQLCWDTNLQGGKDKKEIPKRKVEVWILRQFVSAGDFRCRLGPGSQQGFMGISVISMGVVTAADTSRK